MQCHSKATSLPITSSLVFYVRFVLLPSLTGLLWWILWCWHPRSTEMSIVPPGSVLAFSKSWNCEVLIGLHRNAMWTFHGPSSSLSSPFWYRSTFQQRSWTQPQTCIRYLWNGGELKFKLCIKGPLDSATFGGGVRNRGHSPAPGMLLNPSHLIAHFSLHNSGILQLVREEYVNRDGNSQSDACELVDSIQA